MYPEISVWLIILLAIVCANLPFLTKRIFAFVPYQLKGEPEKFAGFYTARALISYALMGFTFYLLSEPAFPLSAKLFALFVYILIFMAPGYFYGKYISHKNIGIELLELILAICFVAAVGFFIESYYANKYTQSWQFYAIGICIFLSLIHI